ncbi:hypothetical protein [Psychromonas hadalis]|nr:hypothetical protein [Psychromonas hadalis]
MIKHKTYSKEFKLDAMALVRERNYGISETAGNLKVSVQALGRPDNIN